MRGKKRKTIALIILTLVGIAVIALNNINGYLVGGDRSIPFLGEEAFDLTKFNGILQMISSVCCIIMVCVDYRRGARLGIGILGFSILSTSLYMLRSHTLSPVLGNISALITIMAIVIIYKLLKADEIKSFTDYTTGLVNLRGFLELLDSKFRSQKSCTVVNIQIDKFRTVNDEFGHEVGDKALIVISERIKEIVGNSGTVCRIGGTEFAIIFNEGDTDKIAVVRTIIKSISERIVIDKGEVSVCCYLEGFAGMASFPKDATDSETLIKCVDVALLHAIDIGVNNISVFDSDMYSEIHREKELERLIKEALKENYFYLVYQPQYKINGKELRGFESLIRLNLPDGTFVSPGEFIPVAEKSSLIFDIDDYVLKRAMQDFGPVLNNTGKKITISVNISANGMGKENFAETVLDYLKEYNFPADCLELEITEYSFAESQERTITNIDKLRKEGVQLAIDDFGTGYTSLSQLINLPVNLLKIDKSLIDDIEEDAINSDFVTAIVYMGHLMGCEVIAEGAEAESQLEILKLQDCDFVQGYVWGKPYNFDMASQMVK